MFSDQHNSPNTSTRPLVPALILKIILNKTKMNLLCDSCMALFICSLNAFLKLHAQTLLGSVTSPKKVKRFVTKPPFYIK